MKIDIAMIFAFALTLLLVLIYVHPKTNNVSKYNECEGLERVIVHQDSTCSILFESKAFDAVTFEELNNYMDTGKY